MRLSLELGDAVGARLSWTAAPASASAPLEALYPNSLILGTVFPPQGRA